MSQLSGIDPKTLKIAQEMAEILVFFQELAFQAENTGKSYIFKRMTLKGYFLSNLQTFWP